MNLHRLLYSIAAIGLAFGITGTSLIAMAGRGVPIGQYPNATRIAAREYWFGQTAPGQVRVADQFYTSDAMTDVVAWYRQQYELGSPGATGNCLVYEKTNTMLVLYQSIRLRICDQTNGPGTSMDIARSVSLNLLP